MTQSIISMELLFTISEACVDTLTTLKEEGQVEHRGILFATGDEEFIIALDEQRR